MKLPEESTDFWKEDGYQNWTNIEDVVNFIDNETFHIGQGYSHETVRKLECKLCGNDKFYVGSWEYYTAIKCIQCNMEICVHEG